MTDDDRFESLLSQASHTYNDPPAPPLEEMWAAIENEAFNSVKPITARAHARSLWRHPLLQVAAVLVIGIVIGRGTSQMGRAVVPQDAASADMNGGGAQTVAMSTTPNRSLEPSTERYLGQATELLASLPSETPGSGADVRFASRAGELLLTTRLLLDSPAANADPSFRELLEDLELVLAQIVRLPHESGRAELDLINQAVEQRDVLPRLRSVAAANSAD